MSDVHYQPVATCACGCNTPIPVIGHGDTEYDFVGTGLYRRRVFFVNATHHDIWKVAQPTTQ